MSVKAVGWARQQKTGSATRKLVLMVIADRVKEVDGELVTWAGQDALAEDAEVSARTVRAALADLETAGVITREHRRRPDGYRTSDVIRLHLDHPMTLPETPSPETDSGSSEQGEPTSPAKASGKSHRKLVQTSPEDDDRSHRKELPRGDGKYEPEVEPSPRAPARGQPPTEHQPATHPQSFTDLATDEAGFREFWGAFPRRVNEHGARKAFREALGYATPEDIIDGARRYNAHVTMQQPQFVFYPDKWLRERHWKDEYATQHPGHITYVTDPQFADPASRGQSKWG